MVTVSDRYLVYQSRSVVVFQPQPKVMLAIMHPSSDDDEHASGSSSKDDDVLEYAANWG